MATGPSMYQKKQAARRATADIERLAKTYQSGLFDVAQQQATGFKDWTAQTKAVMAPYEAAVTKYTQQDFPAYQRQVAAANTAFQQQSAAYNQTVASYDAQVAAYRQRLDAYNATLADIAANPSERVNISPTYQGRAGAFYNIGGQQYSANNLPPEYFLDAVVTGQGKDKFGRPYDITEQQLFRTRSVPTFNEEPPKAPSISAPTLSLPSPPSAPAQPKLPTFETGQFQQKREELGKTFEREVGERKAAKQNVVMRRMSRGMLEGA
jgi:hypothetical protein